MDIRSLDRPLQAQFRNTTDEDVADQPEAVAARNELEQLQAEHAANVADFSRLVDLQARLDAQAVERDEQEKAVLEAQINEVAQALLTGQDIRTLKLDGAELHRLRIAKDAIPAARERLKAQLQAAQNRVYQTAYRESNAEAALRRVLDDLRLDLARSRL